MWPRHTLTTLAAPALVSCTLGLAPQSNDQQPGCGTVCTPQGAPPAHSSAYVSGGCPGWSCDPGWAACGQGACATDLTSDPKNCGDCGNVCPGTCAMGSCQHIDVLRSNLSLPDAVVVDSTNAYFVDQVDGGTLVESVALSGGGAKDLGAPSSSIVQLAVDDSGLYCAAEGAAGPAVQRLSPGPTSTVASAGSWWGALAVGGGFVWWLTLPQDVADAGTLAATPGEDAGEDSAEGGAVAEVGGDADAADAGGVLLDLVRSSETDGGTQVVTRVGPASPVLLLVGHPLAIANGDAFLASNDSVVVVRAGSSSAETLATDILPVTQVALDDSFVYWTAGPIPPLIEICIFGSCDQDSGPPSPPPGLRRVPRDGGSVVTLTATTLSSLTASDGFVWGTEPGTAGDDLVRIDGSGQRTLIAGGLGSIQGVAVDAVSVYWTVQLQSGGGMLLRTAR